MATVAAEGTSDSDKSVRNGSTAASERTAVELCGAETDDEREMRGDTATRREPELAEGSGGVTEVAAAEEVEVSVDGRVGVGALPRTAEGRYSTRTFPGSENRLPVVQNRMRIVS